MLQTVTISSFMPTDREFIISTSLFLVPATAASIGESFLSHRYQKRLDESPMVRVALAICYSIQAQIPTKIATFMAYGILERMTKTTIIGRSLIFTTNLYDPTRLLLLSFPFMTQYLQHLAFMKGDIELLENCRTIEALYIGAVKATNIAILAFSLFVSLSSSLYLPTVFVSLSLLGHIVPLFFPVDDFLIPPLCHSSSGPGINERKES